MKRAKNVIDLEYFINNGTVVVASDVHIPFQDDDAVKAFRDYCAKKQPEAIVLNGDIVDFYMLSRFTKGEGRNPYEEIKMCQEFMDALRKACPKAAIFYVIGNHEARLEKNILTKAPEMASLIEDVFTILRTSDYNVRGCASVTISNIVFKHGTLLGNKSGLSAIKEMENSYMSGLTGHTHRLCKYIARKAGRKFFWIETGCLCDLNPEYVIQPNWQQGFATVTFENGKVKSARVLEIENGEII